MIAIVERDGFLAFSVKVVPGASNDAVGGETGGALKVRVAAPPQDGKANEALCRLLAERLNIARSAVRIVAGERSRTKRVIVRGVTAERLQNLAGE
jgi:uncharacterized protein